MDFRISSCSTETIQQGTILEYRLKVRGLPTKWRSLIREWNPPHHFVDEQLHGPYRRWHHKHSFEALVAEDGGPRTRVLDQVDYAVPGGKIIERLFVRGQLDGIFSYRHKVLGEVLGA